MEQEQINYLSRYKKNPQKRAAYVKNMVWCTEFLVHKIGGLNKAKTAVRIQSKRDAVESAIIRHMTANKSKRADWKRQRELKKHDREFRAHVMHINRP